MKRQLFIILLLGTSVCLSWGQNNPKEYYKYINEAELACLQMSDENDLGQKAARCYEKAFAANRPFSKDLRQYLLLYSYNKQGRLDIALECAHILAQRGMLWPKWYDADTAFQRIDVVEKAVKEGTYDARSYMDFYDECLNWRCQADTGCDTRYGLGFNSNIVIGNTLFIYPTGDVAEINAHRKELGVSETYADYEKKLQAAFFHGAGFVPRLNIGDFGDPEEDAAAAAEARAEIDSGKYKGRYIIKQ